MLRWLGLDCIPSKIWLVIFTSLALYLLFLWIATKIFYRFANGPTH